MSANSQFDLHPDAESLNGFMEQALPDAEWAQVVSHLAACSRCREILYLAQGAAPLPESRAAAAVHSAEVEAVRPGLWFWRWRLAWATAAVGFASMAAVAIYVYNRPAVEQRQVAIATPEPAPKISAPAAQMSAASPGAAPVAAPAASPAPVPPASRQIAPARERAPVATHGAGYGEGEFALKALPRPQGSVSGAAGGIVASNDSTLKQAPGPSPAILIQPATSDSILQAYSGKAPKASAYRAVPSAPASMGLHSSQAGQQGQVGAQAQARQQAPVQSFEAQSSNQPTSQPAITNVVNPNPAPPPATETVEVSAAQVQLEPEAGKTARLAAGSLRSQAKATVEKKAAPIKLPSGLPAISTISSRRIMLAVDATGALFLSSDSGKNWETVSRQWSGRAVRVRIVPGGPGDSGPADSLSGIAGGNLAVTDLARPAANFQFEIVNDSGSIWTSTDGKTWKQKQN